MRYGLLLLVGAGFGWSMFLLSASPSAAAPKPESVTEQLVARIRAVPGLADRQFSLLVRLKIKKQQVEQMLAAAQKAAPLSQKEAGCLMYTFQQNVAEPTDWVLLETWQNLSALEQHFTTSHFEELVQTLGVVAAEPPQIEIFQTVANDPKS